MFGEGLVTSNGSKHNADRACLAKYFIKSSVDQYIGYMVDTTKDMIETTLRPKDGKVMDVQELFHMLALRVFGYFSAGHDYSKDPQAKWINRTVSHGSNVIGEHIVLGIPVWDIIPRIRLLKSDVKKMHAHIEGLVQQRLKLRSLGYPENDDPLKGMLDANMTRKEIYEHFTTLLSAGHDTTAFFSCYMAYMLAEHPDVQAKMKAEVKEVLGENTNITKEDAAKLKYTSCVMKEVLRMYTVIPFVNRTTTGNVKLNEANISLPKGTTCLIPLCLMNRDANVWDKPNEFRPSRFEQMNISTNSAKHGYLPFGYGSRTCIGNTLALTEGCLMFALLMQKVTFVKVSGFKPKITAGISLTSSNGIQVGIRFDK